MDFQAIREKQESDISLLQNQITHFQSTLDGLQNDQTQLEQQIETIDNMNKKLAILVIVFSGIAALLSGGIRMMVAYAANIALISLGYLYMVNNKKNEILTTAIEKNK